jgi:bifunctional non-homologous end joining protein LigD
MAGPSQTTGEAPLGTYRRKRDFARTPEPSGASGAAGPDRRHGKDAGGPEARPGGTGAQARFVVQRHRARRLHYDFRLEIDGVLVSWAVPKGPTLDPGVRRAAFHVEDHPLEYFDFEGVIPAGEYGGGDVIVWDKGTWELDEAGGPAAPGQALRAGELHLDLYGQKLRGRFLLVRTGTTGAPAGAKEQWLLLHKHDEHAVDGWDPEEHPRSVVSGRTNDDVEREPERMWRPGEAAERAEVRLREGAAGKLSAARPDWPAPSQDELGELDAMGSEGLWKLWGRELRVTNLDKVLFPARQGEEPLTKRDFLAYAARVAPVVLPYLQGRALNMHRFPNGAGSKGFWHKSLPEHAPDWAPRWENPRAAKDETRTYLVVDEPAALVWAANFGALEWHAWTSRTDHPDEPTYAMIDLDPGERTTWDQLLVLARLHRTALEHLHVRGYPKLTGQRGVQIWVPVRAGLGFDATRTWTERLSRAVGAVVPELVSWKWNVGDRSGLARLDYTQNAKNKTLVAPYSPRPAPGAPVSAPIEWDELDDPQLAPDKFTVRTIMARIAAKGDLFRGVLERTQDLPPIS